MSIVGYHHIGLFVSDIERSLKFYKEGFGASIKSSFTTADGKEIHLIDLGNNTVIELIPRGSGGEEVNARWVHISLESDDIEGDFKKALKSGAVSRTEPKLISINGLDSKNAFIIGPEGEVIEFFQILV